MSQVYKSYQRPLDHNDLWHNLDDNRLYMFNKDKNEWIPINSQGETGDTGFSPTAKVESTSDGAKVTITDKSGTTTANITNGVDGFTPSASVETTDNGAIITITDKTGTTTAELDNTIRKIPVDLKAAKQGYIVVGNKNVGDAVSLTPSEATSEYSNIVLGCYEGDKFLLYINCIVANIRGWAFLDSTNHLISKCEDTLRENTPVLITAPQNANKVVIQFTPYTNIPSTYKVYRIIENLVEAPKDGRLYGRENGEWKSIAIRDSFIDLSLYSGGLFLQPTHEWVIAATGTGYNIPVTEGATYKIKTPSNISGGYPAVYAVTTNSPEEGVTAVYAEGYDRKTVITPNSILEITIPKGGKYLYFSEFINDRYTRPQYIQECEYIPSYNPLHDLFTGLGAAYNDTDSVIIKTAPWGESVEHQPKCWYLNGLGDITETQMINIYNYSHQFLQGADFTEYFYSLPDGVLRTNFCRKNGRGEYSAITAYCVCANRSDVEIFAFARDNSGTTYVTGMFNFAFQDCKNLKYIIGKIRLNISTQSITTAFRNCESLIGMQIENLNSNMNLPQCKSLNNASILYLIQKAGTANFTVTLHPDVYARVMADTDIQTALAEKTNITIAQ